MFFNDFVFLYAVYVLLFKLRGLDIWQISLLMVIWSGAVIFFEIPSGAWADHWNRKVLISIGQFSKLLGFIIWYYSNTFSFFALGFIFWGIQEAFCSGSREALLYDTLKSFKKESQYEKVAGKGGFYANLAIGISVFLGGFIASYSMNLVILLSVGFMFIAFIITLLFPNIKIRTEGEKTHYFMILKQSFQLIFSKTRILKLMLYSMLILTIIGVLEEYQQLYFNWIHIPIAFFGVASVLLILAQACGNRYAYKVSKVFNNRNTIYYIALLGGLSLFITPLVQSLIMMIFLIMVFFFHGLAEILLESRLQQLLKSDQRATVLSINSLLTNAIAIFLVLIFGWVSKMGGLQYGFIIFAFIMISYSVLSIILPKRLD